MAQSKPKVKSISDLMKLIANDSAIEQKIKDNPLDAITEYADLSVGVKTANMVYFGALVFLGFVLLLVIFAVVLLALNGQAIPEVLVAIGSAGVGALAGLLAPSPLGINQ
jgi:hypothetical protein